MRIPTIRSIWSLNVPQEYRILIDADNFIEVAEAPTGFMVIKRHVFQS
jgi:hypothetical protein